MRTPHHHAHLNLGLSLPTGSTTKRDDILTPMGMRPNVRLPYPMQLGSGTFDLLPGITYTGKHKQLSWGAQYMGVLRLGENDEDYTLGDEHNITGWAAYAWQPAISTSLRLAYTNVGNIDGQDAQIIAPVQTADPDRQGKERLDLLLGVNMVGQKGGLRGHRFALEFGAPVYQDLDGPQLKTDWVLTAGYQYAF